MSEVMEELTEVFALASGAVKLANTIIEATKKGEGGQDKDYAQIGSSGDSAQIGSSGDYAKIGSSGDYAQIGSSGDSAQIGSSGYYAQIGSSGDSAQIGSSGYSAKIDSTGCYSVISAIGINSIVKAKKGSWITLAEYRKDSEGKYKVRHVQTEYVDGVIIKEDTWYCLFNKKFHEAMNFDGIWAAVISHKGNVYKVVNFGDTKSQYVVTDGVNFSHGETIKQAKADLIYKISNRDTSQYKELTLDSVVSKAEAIQMYRVITGACEAGTKHFVSGLAKTKAKYKISELIELTSGQYGSDTFENFFKGNKDD